jgi:AraC family transcriptional regulator
MPRRRKGVHRVQHRLESGEYYGTVLRRQDFGPVLVTETRHRGGSRIPRHAHRNAYFCFVRQGDYVERYGSNSRDCGPLTVAFHVAEEEHSEEMNGTDVRSLNVEVSADWLAHVRDASRGLREPCDCRGGSAAWLAARLYSEFRWGDATSRLMIEGILLEIVAEMARAASPGSAAPSWLRRVRATLHERFRENLSPTDLASEAGTHPVHLAAAFRRHFGCSPGEYVRKCRVEYAVSRLAAIDVSLADLAADAGFADQSHFTRTFRHLTGLTPAAFRRAATCH